LGTLFLDLTGLVGATILEKVISSESLAEFGDRLSGRSADQRFPYACQWELTCRCNLRCQMCYTDCFNTPERVRKELSFEEIERVLGELSQAGCVEIVFTGGEPLARPDFPEIYRAAHRLGFLLTVFTNATLITDSIVECWSQFRPKNIEVSIHGATAGTFDLVTRKLGSYERFREGIQTMLRRGLPVSLKAVALTFNKEELLQIAAFARSLGVAFRMGEYLRDDLVLSGRPFRFQLEESALQEIERDDAMLWREKKAELARPSPEPVCGGGNETFHIDAYGGLQLCSNNRRDSYDLRQGSFADGFKALPRFYCAKRRTPALVSLEPAAR
jgi:MoaA/NifB/PqqE/SkfB family radical SAM enzyme